MQKVFALYSDKNMRLVPSANVNVVYSESPKTAIIAPKFSMTNICVYNHNSYGGTNVGGTADIDLLNNYQSAIMQYVEYRKYAVESS